MVTIWNQAKKEMDGREVIASANIDREQLNHGTSIWVLSIYPSVRHARMSLSYCARIPRSSDGKGLCKPSVKKCNIHEQD